MEKLLLEHLWVVIAVLVLTIPLKAAALWRSARRGHLGWFLTLIIINTLGILELLYIFIFSSWGIKKREQQKKQEEAAQQVRQVRQSKFSSSAKSKITIV